ALISNDGNLRLWDAATLTDRLPESGHRGAVHSLAFVDGDRTLLSSSFGDATVRAWDHSSGKERGRIACVLPNPQFGVNITHSTDSPGFVVWNHQHLRWVEPGTNKQRDLPLDGEMGVQAVSLSPDGRTLAVLINGKLKIWDT